MAVSKSGDRMFRGGFGQRIRPEEMGFAPVRKEASQTVSDAASETIAVNQSDGDANTRDFSASEEAVPIGEEAPTLDSGPSPADGPDPIEAAAGRSVDLQSVYDFRWAGGVPYLSTNAKLILDGACARFAPPGEAPYELSADDLINTLLSDAVVLDDMFIGQLRNWAREKKVPPPAVPTGSPLPSGGARPNLSLRWDLVEILAEASKLRRRVNPEQGEIGTRHLTTALMRTRSGQVALDGAGLLEPGFEQLKRDLVAWLHDFKAGSLGDNTEEWLRIGYELQSQEALISLSIETPVSYAADRAQRLPVDSLGVREDAAALSGLILLESATPPLAIGLFGAWGSGKSTLIKELQHRIHEDLKQENDLAKAGLNDANRETRRVRNVVQIEFNAWAYADSANLWASLASEIFDQLAAGGVRPEGEATSVDRRYDEVVRDVKLLNSEYANTLRTSGVEIAELEQDLVAAKAALRSAGEEGQTVAGRAAAETVEAVFGVERSGGAASGGSGGAVAQPASDGMAIVRDALRGGDDPQAQIKAYAEAGVHIVGLVASFLKFLWVLTKRLPHSLTAMARGRWPILLGASAVIAAAAALMLLTPSWSWIVATVGPRAAALGPWLATAGAAVWAFLVAIFLPAVRFFALLRRDLARNRAAAREKEQEARNMLRDVETRLEAALAAREDARTKMESYGALADDANAASPDKMLEFLMSGSADVDSLRQQRGVIARVRRCFEQLDAVLKKMREPRSPKAIDRIILYIDDLDRCDAAQVSEVLEAVHLLLAFECFVVVVAVDARWLKRSLETHHVQLKHAPAAQEKAVTPSDDTSEAGADAPETGHDPPATAADYLEKIFQIPLWVRPLVDKDATATARYSAYEALVASIAKPEEKPKEVIVATPVEPDLPVGLDAPPDETGGRHDFVWTDSRRPENPDRPRRRGLRLTEDELRTMKALGPLAATSPRAVKRMINLYRLLRVRYRDDRLDAFLANGDADVPSFRELLFALACENGLSAPTRRKARDSLAEIKNINRDPWSPSALKEHATAAEYKLVEEIDPTGLGPLTQAGIYTALEEVRRFSFLP